MKSVSRTRIILLAIAVAFGIGVWMSPALWPEIRAWAAGQQAGPKSEHAGHDIPPAKTSGERKILYWFDPMHTWYKSDKPGIAPDCGMKLVPMYADEATAGLNLPPGTVQISPSRQQLMGVKTASAEYRTLDKTIRAVGSVALDETRTSTVHVRVSGWVQKVFVDFRFDHVRKGEPLFTFYSPDLVATQQEYLIALRAEHEFASSPYPEVARGGKSLVEAARQRLELWDFTSDQLAKLEETGKAEREITYYSPVMGHVLERNAFPNQYVTPETELYKIVDHSVVWVFADIYENEFPFVSLGQEALITTDALPGAAIRGQVNYLQPHVMEDTRTLPVRIEVPNPELKLNPGMFVNVTLHRSLGRGLTVPVDAVLDSGQRQVVFVDRGQGTFEPRQVEVAERTADYAVIARGLKAGERVVTRANFLIDSESNLREAMAGMGGMPQGAPAAGQGAAAPSTPGSSPSSQGAGPASHQH